MIEVNDIKDVNFEWCKYGSDNSGPYEEFPGPTLALKENSCKNNEENWIMHAINKKSKESRLDCLEILEEDCNCTNNNN